MLNSKKNNRKMFWDQRQTRKQQTRWVSGNSPFRGCFAINMISFEDISPVILVISHDENSFEGIVKGEKKTFPIWQTSNFLFFAPKGQLSGKKFYLPRGYSESYNTPCSYLSDHNRGLNKIIKMCGGKVTRKLKGADYIVVFASKYSYESSFNKEHKKKLCVAAKKNGVRILNQTDIANLIRNQ